MTISSDIHAGVAGDVAAIKDRIRQMVEQSVSPVVTTKELLTMKGLRLDTARRVRQMLSGFQNHGTPSRKIAHSNGRHRRKLPDGRVLHATKGFKGGRKHSRRSNRS
jgi:hypothetical protein